MINDKRKRFEALAKEVKDADAKLEQLHKDSIELRSQLSRLENEVIPTVSTKRNRRFSEANNLLREIRQIERDLEIARFNEKVKTLANEQPNFWEATERESEKIVNDVNTGFKLTMSSDVNMCELVQSLKRYEDVEKFGWGTEAKLLSEAQRIYDTGIKQICRETVKGTLPTAEATQSLTYPIQSLLKDRRIKNAIGLL